MNKAIFGCVAFCMLAAVVFYVRSRETVAPAQEVGQQERPPVTRLSERPEFIEARDKAKAESRARVERHRAAVARGEEVLQPPLTQEQLDTHSKQLAEHLAKREALHARSRQTFNQEKAKIQALEGKSLPVGTADELSRRFSAD